MKKVAPSYETPELREFAEVLRGRRTIELFLQTPVPTHLLDEAIDAATWAPNHHLTEPWHFYALGSKTKEQCLDLCRDIVTAKKGEKAGAFKRQSWSEKPGWLVVTCERSEDELLQKEDYAACYPRFFDIVGIDEAGSFVVGLIWYGYPKLTPAQSRKGADEVITGLP